ncbi:MAG: hypothetical protein MJ078_06500 [Clostridia bacterium]|nr:hypothetical protein [Clostridia bacterium]
MQIVYFGSDVFLNVFRYLRQKHRILVLYTYHNEEDYFSDYAIVREAQKAGIEVRYLPPSSEEMDDWIKQGANLFFSAEYAYKLPIPHSDAFRGVNLHSSLLPEGRSYYPIEYSMYSGQTEYGVSMHKLTEELDGGAILSQKKFSVTRETDSVDCYLYSAGRALEMVKEVLADFEKAWQNAVPQSEKKPYRKRPPQEEMTLRHTLMCRDALEIFRKYNKMTEVSVGDTSYFVESLTAGHAPLQAENGELFLNEGLLLYGVADGHLRLSVRKKQ